MICQFLNSFTGAHTFICKNVRQGLTHLWEDHKTVVIGTVSLCIAVKAHSAYKRNQRRKKWNAVGRDVIVLHGFSRATTIPSLSPFILKLETYLRMAGLKYEFDIEEPLSSKSKSPWITINGEAIADSAIIMDFLANKFNLNFSTNLTSEQKGAARSMTIMADEHLFWGLADWRVLRDKDHRMFDMFDIPFYFKVYILLKFPFRQRTIAQGIGLHSDKEIETMMTKDIEAFSLYLGEKPFMMGNEPCEVDCAVFGILAQFVWAAPGSSYAVSVQSDYRNLLHYCIRMREKFYPDWNKCLWKKK